MVFPIDNHKMTLQHCFRGQNWTVSQFIRAATTSTGSGSFQNYLINVCCFFVKCGCGGVALHSVKYVMIAIEMAQSIGVSCVLGHLQG
jgi:hypothetical protein